MSLVVFTGLCGLLAAPGHIHPVPFPVLLGFTAILCIAMAAGGAAALNMWWEADIDAGMKRTAARPIPAGRMDPTNARDFGIALSVASVLLMGLAIGWLAAGSSPFRCSITRWSTRSGSSRARRRTSSSAAARGRFRR